MDPLLAILLFGVVVFLTHMLEGVTGFGCTVLALPFAAALLGLHTAVPVLVVLGWLLAIYIVARSWRHIQWKPFLFIVLHAAIGLPIGMLLFDKLPETGLKALLATFMVGVGFRGFVKTWRAGHKLLVAKDTRSVWMRLVLLTGGVIHGAFGTGGPFVVIYAGRALPDKSLFRVTLCLLWTVLNTILIVKWTVIGGVWNPQIMKAITAALPFLVAGIAVGDWLHHRVNERLFRMMVYGVLFLAGTAVFYGLVMGK
ncbi:MAG: sulfite exporter TauE/SafE family protein [Kiritimatiellaceae bacterium]|nr:sulfite exporter TauE/SafE family protein [Kiritimatiellaceae bacterium]